MKKLFGGIDLTWKKVIIFAILSGVYTALMAIIPGLHYSSFNTITATLEVWIFFGIIIIMNSKSNKDSALKCFVFFLISQPLIYLLQVPFSWQGWRLFQYYRFWFVLTVLCLPMGYIGYYMKKDKWWGYLILLPMILIVASSYSSYLSSFIFSYPKYILIVLFCAATMIIYPLYIFNSKIIKIVGVTISGVLLIIYTIFNILNPPIYDTEIMGNNEEHAFDGTYRTYLTDSKYGIVEIKYYDEIENYMIHANFKREGSTTLVIEAPTKEKEEYRIDIKRDTYKIDKITTENYTNKEKEKSDTMSNINITLENKDYILNLEDNETTKELLRKMPQELTMQELNGNEKYAYLDFELPTNQYNPNKINRGDVMLFGSNCLVIFYKTFDTIYSYTKIGHIDNLPEFDNNSITIKIEK